MPSDEPIAGGTRIGRAQLRVSELERAADFYEDVLGLERLGAGEGPDPNGGPAPEAQGRWLGLGAGGVELLRLREVPGATRPGRAAGLYHVAVLVPSRADLGAAIRRVLDAGWPVKGASDHGFSEALYLPDADGNGLEVYADRPRDDWPEPTDLEAVRPRPMDVDSVLGEAADEAPRKMPAGTRVGHLHLHVGDLEEASRFYVEGIGFEPYQVIPGQAHFVSAGGYHHHVAFNSWAGRGVGPPPEGSTGIDGFEVLVPEAAEVKRAEARLGRSGLAAERADGTLVTRDPAAVWVTLRPAEPGGGPASA